MGMKPVDSPAAQATPRGPSLESADDERRKKGVGVGLMTVSAVSNQSGAALGALAFAGIGPIGVVAIRQIVTALVLMPLVRPSFRRLTGHQWRLILGLASVFSLMNLSLYLSIERIGLGLAVTIEFLGPLSIAIATTRRALDIVCALLAAAGVVILVAPGPSMDLLGVGSAMVAAASWASYILLNRSAGRHLRGLHGTAAASAISASVWVPLGIAWFSSHIPTAQSLCLASACGLLSSVVPYVADLQALRRVPASLFGTFTSLNPAWAALAGWLFLRQSLTAQEWTGVVLVMAANAIVTGRELLPTRTRRQ